MRTPVVLGIAAIATAAAVMALNLVLLGYASPRTEPVGLLSPAAHAPRAAPVLRSQPPRSLVVPARERSAEGPADD